MNRNENKVKIDKPQNWQVIAWWGLIVLPLLYFSRTETSIKFEDYIRLPIEHEFRDLVGRTPKIDPRLKVIGFDDRTFLDLNDRYQLFDSEWLSIFEFLSKKKPNAIVFDGNMSRDIDFEGGAASKILESEKNIDFPLHVGVSNIKAKSFLSQTEILYPGWPLEGCEKQSNFNCFSYKDSSTLKGELLKHYKFSQANGHVYPVLRQPHEKWHSVIKGAGHISWPLAYGGRVPAVLYQQEDLSPYPYLGLSAFNNWEIKDNSVFVGKHIVPTDSKGYMQANYLPPEVILNRSVAKSASIIKKSINSGKEFDFVKEGDFVLIIPLMYSGNPDIIWSPYGEVPGGLVLASIANSALTGQYIKPLGNKFILTLVSSISAAAIGVFLPSALSAAALILVPSLSILSCLLLFSFASISVPWLYPFFAFVLIYIPILIYRFVLKERSIRSLNIMLEGMVDEKKIKELTRNVNSIEMTPREKVVTIMFIDIEGFSLLVENMVPRSAFRELKTMMSLLVKVVHEHGGIVDKTLGDGLLAYFGHDLTGAPYRGNHALDALLCSIELQKRNTEIIKNGGNKGKFYPLRIGVNTATVFLGNLGNENRIDYTLVGNGVNFAKRLEGACKPNEILISQSSEKLLSGTNIREEYKVEKMEIKIKHHSAKMESFTINPFEREPELFEKLKAITEERLLLDRESIRVTVTDPSRVVVSIDGGEAELKNFSRTGVSLLVKGLTLYEGRVISFNFDSSDGSLGAQLVEEGIGNLKGVVQWAYEDNARTTIGIKYEDLENFKAQRMFEILSNIIH